MLISNQPISDIQFNGLHWIEASAGTGKTYTLSSLLVRVLMEDKMPNEVVATTFTRAATAELKGRIRDRLVETYRFFDKLRLNTTEENISYSKVIAQKDILLSVLLVKFSSRVSYACERAKLIIDHLDDLFIGTLDSFSQKLLKEFSFESGKIESNQITESKPYIEQIIHDSIRNWIGEQPQLVVNLMYSKKKIKDVSNYVRLVQDALSFNSAQFEKKELTTIDVSNIESTISKINVCNLDLLKDYFLLDGCYFNFVNKRSFANENFNIIFTESIVKLIKISTDKKYSQYFLDAFKEHKALLESFLKNFKTEKIFTAKCPTESKDLFYNNNDLKYIVNLIDVFVNIEKGINHAELHLENFICEEAKLKLPQLLKSRSETTFTQQITHLLEVINSESGTIFKNAIQKRYPIIFVDEFQDTNQDQDDILAAIWRDAITKNSTCMVMVGDRKQAIYGFRGGDMLTFINAYNDVLRKGGSVYHLIQNHRTIAPLVSALDRMFSLNPQFGEGVDYVPVVAGDRSHPKLACNEGHNFKPLRFINIDKSTDPYKQLAWQISDLLNKGDRGEIYFEANSIKTRLNENDIAVLAKNNEDLDRIQYEIERLGISVNRGSNRSVFTGIVAQDIGALLAAILNPENEKIVRRALLSSLMKIDIKKLIEIEKTSDGLGKYIREFNEIRNIWLTRGFLSAWNYMLSAFNIWGNISSSKTKETERNVVNLRHIEELLTQQSLKLQGYQRLYQWYLRQITKPEKRDWELERNLTSDYGVNILTIHKSKGLEYKVVYLFKADAEVSDKRKSFNYSKTTVVNSETNEIREKRVISLGDNQSYSQEELDDHNERLEAENKRLWYVALTRASHRLYVMMHDEKKGLNGVGYWINTCEFESDQIELSTLLNGPSCYQSIPDENYPIFAQELPTKKFYPKQNTSFSNLAQHLTKKQASDFMVESQKVKLIADENHNKLILDFDTGIKKPLKDVNKNFIAGTVAGTFLHEILASIDFTCPDNWAVTTARKLKNSYSGVLHALSEKTKVCYPTYTDEQVFNHIIESIVSWIEDITTSVFAEDISLNKLDHGSYISEMEFTLSMSDSIFDTKKIHSVLLKHGINIPEINEAKASKYLKGSIDLLYFYNGQFHLADYKSNFLGGYYQDYSESNIQKNMMQNSYYLQAALYFVALHRYLESKIDNYSIETHLGKANYIYLRGMDGENGSFNWSPSHQLTLELNEIIGK